jgi:hypothetical protein
VLRAPTELAPSPHIEAPAVRDGTSLAGSALPRATHTEEDPRREHCDEAAENPVEQRPSDEPLQGEAPDADTRSNPNSLSSEPWHSIGIGVRTCLT